jgi:hypothetical protein
MAWGAVAGSVIGGVIAADAASSASDAQVSASNNALGVTQAQYNQNRADNTPYRQTGVNALNRMLAAMGLPQQQQSQTIGANGQPVQASVQQATDYATLRNELKGQYQNNTPDQAEGVATGPTYDEASLNQAIQQEAAKRSAANSAATAQPAAAATTQPTDMASLMGMDPGYQFRQSEGQKGVERSAAARGGLFSGRAAKDLTRFNQGIASSEFGNAWNRLAGLAGVGQQATNQDMAQSTSFANNASNLITGAGNARASGYVGSANAINSGIGNGISQYQNAQYVNALRNNKSTPTATYAPYQYGGSYNPDN